MNQVIKVMAGHRQLCTKEVEDALGSIVQFLEPYLPLANAHATDFITKDFWNTLIPCCIQDELTKLSETDVRGLACTLCQTEESVNVEKIIHGKTELHPSSQDETRVLCQTKSALQTDNTEKNGSRGKIIDLDGAEYTEKEVFTDPEKSLHMDWKHRTLNEFCIEAQKCTMEYFCVVESYEKFVRQDLCKEKPFVGTYMSEKKSHEIERMSAMCKMLVESFDSDLVIDFGSGKGYLGSYLSLQYNISVLGIDAVSLNTKSAEHRTSVIAKQWNGLARNRDREISNIKLTKKEKKVLKGKRSCAKQSESITYVSDKESMLCKANKYKPVTMFIENFTDLGSLITANFPELLCRQKNENKEFLSSLDAEHTRKDNEKVYFENPSEISHDSFSEILQVSDYSPFHLMPEMDAVSNDEDHEIKSVQDNAELDIKSLLTGLHTCGNLANTSLDLFVHSPVLKTLCTVGCCYHLLTEEFSGTEKGTGVAGSYGFPMSSFLKTKQFHLGQTARNLASQSVIRLAESELQGRKFFPRAVLEVLLQRLNVDSSLRQTTSLRGLEQKSKSLQEFLARACEKYDITQKVDDILITNLIQELAGHERKLAAFFQLRTVLAPCIESLIVLDRAHFLLEQANMKDVNIVKIFDPVKSPRCYAIIASKRDK